MRKLICLLVLMLSSCELLKEKVDFVILNANVYKVDDNFSKAEAFAVNKGKFVAIGSTKEIQDNYTAESIIDADGRTITPGFIDAHCHFYRLGMNQQVVDLSGTKSYEEVLERYWHFKMKTPRISFWAGVGIRMIGRSRNFRPKRSWIPCFLIPL